MGAALLPLLMTFGPMLIDLIAKNHGPIQAALANVTGGQPNPLSGLLGLLGGGSTGSSNAAVDPALLAVLQRIAVALEAMIPTHGSPQPVA